jgi:hypothetical protein
VIVDTGQFAAIRDRADTVDALPGQVAAVIAELRELARAQLAGRLERAALIEFGEQRALGEQRARETGRRQGRHARPRGDRRERGHLRLVSGGGE